jgi:hypothetical protein
MTHRFVLTGLLVLLLGACSAARLNPPSDAAVAADAAQVVDEREIVVVTHSAREARSVIRRSATLGYSLVKTDELPALGLTMVTLQVPPRQDGASAIRELESLEPGVTAGINHGYTPQGESGAAALRDGYAATVMQWPPGGCPAHAAIGVLDARLTGPARQSVTTADFSRSAQAEASLHGTQVVTIMQASGMLQSPRIFHADVVSPGTKLGDAASVDALLRGIDWLMQNKVRLINVSLAGPYNKILDRAIGNAARAGVVIVAPVGNSGPGGPVRYPAAFASTIAVTAIDADHQIYRNAVRGPRVDFSAPGVDIAVPQKAGKTFVSGTSFAAPFVTMRIAADPGMAGTAKPDRIRSGLSRNARDLGSKGHDPVFGNGLVRAPDSCRTKG